METAKLLRLLADNRDRGAFALENSGNGPAVLYIYDVIVSDSFWGGVSPADVVAKLESLQPGQDLTVRVNSPGGDVFAGRAIESLLQDWGGKVTVIVDGMAASAASYVSLAANEVVMQPGAFLMIHNAWTIGLGNSNDFLSAAAMLEKIDQSLAETYASRNSTGKDAQYFADLMAAETWLSAQEALDLGLATAIKDVAAPAAATSNQWNLAAYGDNPPSVACPDGSCTCEPPNGEAAHGEPEAGIPAEDYAHMARRAKLARYA